MDGNSFLRLINHAFVPFMNKLGFSLELPHISGRYYRARFISLRHMVSLTFEPGDEVHFVMVHGLKDGIATEIDDKQMAPRLADLNKQFMAKIDSESRSKNETFFSLIPTADRDEQMLLKAAKDLRLVLPMHIKQGRMGEL